MNQRGFATLEVILMVMVIGILASIAVPRFTSVTAAANTAKIQADLSTLDTAIAIYSMENGVPTSAPSLKTLSPYLKDAENIKPPTGLALINGNQEKIKGTNYGFEKVAINSTEGESTEDWRAVLQMADGDKTSGYFVK